MRQLHSMISERKSLLFRMTVKEFISIVFSNQTNKGDQVEMKSGYSPTLRHIPKWVLPEAVKYGVQEDMG